MGLPTEVTGGVVRGTPRCEAVREDVRDMACETRSLAASRSFSRRSATAVSFAVTSTGLAAPNGFDRCVVDVVEGFGEARGEGVWEAPVLFLGRSSSLRRPIWGVGGVELLGEVLFLEIARGLRQSLSSGGVGPS